jgi:hypothetical protein
MHARQWFAQKQWLVVGVTALYLLLIPFFVDFQFLANLFRRINWLYLVEGTNRVETNSS